MSRWLLLTPFYALNPTQKAAVLAFICNELLCNKDINGYVATRYLLGASHRMHPCIVYMQTMAMHVVRCFVCGMCCVCMLCTRVDYAEMDELITSWFGGQAVMGPRNHQLDGVHIAIAWRT